MATLADYITAHRFAYGELAGVTGELTDEQWSVPSLCPDWNVRACVAHVIGVDKLLTGWGPSTEEPPPLAEMHSFMAAAATMSGDDFNAESAAVARGRLADLKGRSEEVLDEPSITPVGRQTFGSFLQIRIFDHWVHARDIALPLGISLPDDGLGAAMAVNQVHRSMGYIAGKLIGLEDGMSMAVNVTGGTPLSFYVAVNGKRAGLVEAVEDPTFTLTADTETFVMLACGRIDPQERIDAGRISWTGDATWGDRAARSLRFTM